MKRIEDEEVKTKFDEAIAELPTMFDLADMPRLYQHFFQAGFDAAMATGGLPQRPKRTIKEIIKRDGEILGFSSDGKVYRFIWHSQEWYSLPDLPQD